MKNGFYLRYLAVLFIFSVVFSGCATFGSKVQLGATQEEVEKLLGKPKEAHKRWLAYDKTREVWVYHDNSPNIKNHLYPETHFIVFSQGKVVAKNPGNPYAPLK